MTVLKKPPMVEVTLPESGIVCKLHATYLDFMEVQRVLLEEIKYDVQGGGKSEQQVITGSTLSRQTTYAITLVVKEWDAETEENGVKTPMPITWENIGLLTPKDGQFLSAEVDKIMNPRIADGAKKG